MKGSDRAVVDTPPDDRALIDQIYQDFQALMFATAMSYTSDPAAQEDIVQDSLVKLIQKAAALRGKSDCVRASYVAATVRNTAIDHLRRRGVIEKHHTSLDSAAADASSVPMEELLAHAERCAQLSALWPKLGDEARLLLEGKYILGYTDNELAEQLGCKPGSIRMKLTRARRSAIALLTGKEETPDDTARGAV